MTRSRRFSHTPESVTSARRFAREVLDGAPEEAQGAAELMISELASNCIRHSDTGFELTIIQVGTEIRVEATDRGAGQPRMRSPGPTDPDGRGLQIIDMLASSWGVEALTGGGKTVWFMLAGRAPEERPCDERPCSAGVAGG